MDPRVNRQAEELGKLLADSAESQRLKEARATMAQHSAAQIMLRDLQQRQQVLQRKQMAGEEITQSEINDLQRVSQVAAMNPYVRGLYEAEMAFSEMMADVQRIMFRAAGIEIPEESDDEADQGEPVSEEAKENEATGKARSRLWVPGQ